MRTPTIITIFFIILLSFVLLVLIGMTPAVDNAVGIPHATIKHMRAAADGELRLSAVGSYAFVFHCLVLAACVGLMLLGVSPGKSDGRLYSVLLFLLAIMLFVWFRIYAGHQNFLHTMNTGYFLGFPDATAWMLYGTGVCGILLVVFYCICFNSYVFNDADADAEAFAKLVAAQTRKEKELISEKE